MTAASLGLTDNQYKNARGIIAAVKARGWPIKAAYIAVETTLAESGMRILASANVPTSQQYPHDLIEWEPDGLGHDHASMGMYQQQTGYAWAPANQGVYQPNPTMEMSTMNSPDGWGTPAELMNAETSTAKFLDALAAQPWQSMTNWAAAQAVQRSAYADGSNYQAEDARAQQIVNALWEGASPDSGNVRPLSEEDDMTPDPFGLAPGEEAVRALAGRFEALDIAARNPAQVYVAIGNQGGKAWRVGWTPNNHGVINVPYGRRVTTGLGAGDEVLYLKNVGNAPIGVTLTPKQ